MRNHARYVAVGMAMGLTGSLVLGSWVVAASARDARAREALLPTLLENVLATRSAMAASLEEAPAAFSEDPLTALRFGQRLRDIGVGLRSVVDDIGFGEGSLEDIAVAVLLADSALYTALADCLDGDPFSVGSACLPAVESELARSRDALAVALGTFGMDSTEVPQFAWDPTVHIEALGARAEALRRAAARISMEVVDVTESSVTVGWAEGAGGWTGIWLQLGNREPVFVRTSTHTFFDLEPASDVQIAGRVALGPSGEFRGPPTDPLDAATVTPPIGEAWLGDQYFSATATIRSDNYTDIYFGGQYYFSVTVTPNCSRGPCSAFIEVFDPVFANGSLTGAAAWDGSGYSATFSGIEMGDEGFCSLFGTMTVTFDVESAQVESGVWTASELSGEVRYRANTCSGTAFVDASFSAYRLQGE